MSTDDGDKAPPGAFVSAAPEPTQPATSEPETEVKASAASEPEAKSDVPATAVPETREADASDAATPIATPVAAPDTDADAKGKRKAPPTGLQLQDVPPPEARRSIEVSLVRGDWVGRGGVA